MQEEERQARKVRFNQTPCYLSPIPVADTLYFIVKTKRKNIDKTTAAAHARNKMTFNPDAFETEGAGPSTPTQQDSAEKKKRRVSMGVAIDAETGEVVNTAKRQSRRTHTMNNTTAMVSRLKDAEIKKVRASLTMQNV